LHRHPVVAVLDAPALEHLVALGRTDGKLDGIHGVGHLDLLEEAARVVRERSRLVEVGIDRLEEAQHESIVVPTTADPREEFREPPQAVPSLRSKRRAARDIEYV